MNDWNRKNRPLIIAEADDFCDKYDRSGLEMLFYWKAKYPKFKITLFTIPNKTSDYFLELLTQAISPESGGPFDPWIEIAVHGWDHDSNFECWGWNYEKTKVLMNRLGLEYKRIFKAPGWTITDKYSGYKASEELPIAKDPQCIYKALMDLNYIIFDRHYDKPARPEGAKIVCVDCNPDIVHMHTWDMVTGDLAGKNGMKQVEELHGVPWDQNTEFFFASEAWEKGLIKPCQ